MTPQELNHLPIELATVLRNKNASPQESIYSIMILSSVILNDAMEQGTSSRSRAAIKEVLRALPEGLDALIKAWEPGQVQGTQKRMVDQFMCHLRQALGTRTR